MAGLTNKVKAEMLAAFFRDDPEPASFFIALVTNANPPGPDTNILSDLTEIAAGNGYVTGGDPIARNSTDFPVSTEDDGNDKGIIGLRDIVFTADGGPLPSSGDGARFAVLIDNNATIGLRKVYLFFDLISDRFLADTQDLQIIGMTAELLEL